MDYPSFCEHAAKTASTLTDAPGWYVRLKVGRRGGTETTRDLTLPCSESDVKGVCDEMLDTYLDTEPCYLELLQLKGTRSHGSCRVEPDSADGGAAQPATREDLMGAILRTNDLLAKQLQARETAWGKTLEQLVQVRIQQAQTDALLEVSTDQSRSQMNQELMREFMAGAKQLLDRQIHTPSDAIRQAEDLAAAMRSTVQPGQAIQLSPAELQRIIALGEQLGSIVGDSMNAQNVPPATP